MKPIDDGKQTKKEGKKLKKEYVLIVVLAVIAILLFVSGDVLFAMFNKSDEGVGDYASIIEDKLENLLSEVDGVGKVKVFVTTDGSSSNIVLKEVDEECVNGLKTSTESVIMVGGKPYVTKTTNPNIVGIAVVCQGADKLSVKLSVTEIITTTLSVDADCVRIIKMK